MVWSEVMITEPQLSHTESHIEKYTSFLDMLQGAERLKIEQMKRGFLYLFEIAYKKGRWERANALRKDLYVLQYH